MKKLTSVIILIIALLAVCSCAQKEQEEFLLEFDTLQSSEVTDLNGYECPIVQDYDIDHPFQYPVGTLMGDMYLQRLKDISNEYNCDITVQTIQGNETARIASNLYVGEIACSHSPHNPAKDGLYYPLDVLKDYLDYTNAEKFGSPGILEQGMFDGIPYTVSPVSWPGKQKLYAYNIFAVNEDTVSKYGLTDPREYVERGEWTWETFEKALPDYQVVDGEYTSTAMNLTWTILDFVMMNGVDYISVSDDGNVAPSLDSQNVIDAFDWCSKLLANHADIISYLGHYDMVAGFINGNITLAQTSFSHMINEMIYDVDNYGAIPFPCGPNGTYGEWVNAYSGADSMAIWVNAKKPEAAAVIIDRIFEPFEGYETPDELQNYASTIFYDRRDVELFTTFMKYSRWNYYTLGIWDYFSSATDWAKRGKTGAEIVDRFADAVNERVKQYVKPNAETILQLYEEEKKD
ncbi:MAG: hypothetical protein IJL30_09640 [Clostridia bacterium]|nr:hypothetical protein [Clostridia bacterium]